MGLCGGHKGRGAFAPPPPRLYVKKGPDTAWSSHYLRYTMSYTTTCPITYFIQEKKHQNDCIQQINIYNWHMQIAICAQRLPSQGFWGEDDGMSVSSLFIVINPPPLQINNGPSLRWLNTVFKKIENLQFRCVFLDNYYLLINKKYITYIKHDNNDVSRWRIFWL